jgi:Rrf2 family protein
MESFLSQTSEYALRATAWLASLSSREPVPARDLAKHSGVPSHYLSKILRRLVLAGILESQKGKAGGFTLARPPHAITFKDVLLAVDAFPLSERCAFGWGACNSASPCPLHGPWTAISQEFRDWAARTTFADLGDLSGNARWRHGVPSGSAE